MHDLTREIAASLALRSDLASRRDSSLLPFFTLLGRFSHSNPDISFEIYDPAQRLLGWAGNSGAAPDSSLFADHDVSRIVMEPLYSYFIVVSPVMDSSIAGYVVVKRLFDVNYPLNNRFINNSVFSSTFDAQMDEIGDFSFTADDSAPPKGGNKFSIPITGVNGATIGYALFGIPSLDRHLESIRETGSSIIRFLFLCAAGILSLFFFSTARVSGSTAKVIFATLAIWFFRYAMIWTSFPSGYFHFAVFDPAYFTSMLAGGLAYSPGDLILSCVALLANVAFIGGVIADQAKEDMEKGEDDVGPGLRWLEIVFCPIFVLLFFAFLRGFLAAMRSAVFDSVLRYNDPMYVVPPFILSLMLISLLMLAVAFIRGCFLVIAFVFRTLGTVPSLHDIRWRWLATIILLLICAISFQFFAAEPLSTVGERIIFSLAMAAGSIIAFGMNVVIVRPFSLRLMRIVIPLAVFMVVYQIHLNVHAADRTAVEISAQQMVKPVDAWLGSVVNRALDDLGTVNPESLNTAPSADQKTLAFFGWAGSILSREGYNCWVAYVNSGGDVISDFHIGLIRHPSLEHRSEHPDSGRTIHVEERYINGELVRVYRGYVPLTDTSGTVAGGVWVELSADRQALLEGEAPEFLRNDPGDQSRTALRNLTYSEYFQGKLLTTMNERFPKDRQLPSEAQRLAPGRGCWVEESIGGANYETFYLLRPDADSGHDEGSVVAISMNVDIAWELFSVIRLVFFYVAIMIVFIGLILLYRYLRSERVTIGFQAKLLGAFLLVSLIPVAVLAYYNREYAVRRESELIAKHLHDESDAVVSTLQKQSGLSAPFDLSKLTDETCGNIATDLGTDFNVYSDAYVQASSKPEVFIAGLFDPRLSADSYVQIVMHKTGFFSEQQTIGNFAYVVGYRPLLSEAGNVIGVVSVPTVYRQNEIDDELMQRNAFLYSAYALALIIAMLAGLVFSRQISLPVRRLQDAARQIGTGNLAVHLKGTRKDEFGDLEDAFNRMAGELQKAQEQAFRAQRELAWKEMARQVAHEIKNPLTPMKLSVQHLRQAFMDQAGQFGEVFDQVTKTVLEQIETLSRIASEFSRFGRMPERFTQLCPIDEVIREALNLFERNDRVELIERLAATGGCIMADREELRRAFINILQNALQAIARAGTITITSLVENGFALVIVTDTGKGIKPEDRERLFEPNFSTKTEGMGLGLALVKKTVDDLGGEIRIDSEVGKGTVVAMRLPVSEA